MQNIDDCGRNLERAFKAMKEQLVDHLLPEPRGILNKVLYGEAPPRGPTPYPLTYHF